MSEKNRKEVLAELEEEYKKRKKDYEKDKKDIEKLLHDRLKKESEK